MREVSWGVVGRGNIGGELIAAIPADAGLDLSPSPDFIATSKGINASDGIHDYGVADIRDIPPGLMPDTLFVACPTTDDGLPASTYVEHALRSGKTVITAEKGALSANFAGMRELSDGFRRLGFTATVGGGSLLLPHAKWLIQGNPNGMSRFVGKFNGTVEATFNDASEEFGRGVPPEEAIAKAVELGYAEPGSHEPFDVLRAELDGDIPKKLHIFLSYILGLEGLTVDGLRGTSLDDDTISQAFAEDRRHVVSVTNLSLGEPQPEGMLIGGISREYQGWLIETGFQRIGEQALARLHSMTGPGNGFALFLGRDGRDGTHTLTGPGAGAGPTVESMLRDHRLLARDATKDMTLAERVKGFGGGAPRPQLSEAERSESRLQSHTESVAALQRAGLKLAYSALWTPHGGGIAIDAYWRAREELVSQYGSDKVLNGPAILPSDGSEDGLGGLGIWIPAGDGSAFAKYDRYLDQTHSGRWVLTPDAPVEPRASSSKLLSIFR